MFDGRLGLGLLFELDNKLNLPPIFQSNKQEVDKGSVTLKTGIEASLCGSITLFAQGNVAFIWREPVGYVSVTSPFAVDYAVRIGVSWPNYLSGISAYMKTEHLSDDWSTLDPVPVTPVSFGLMIAILKEDR
jgi:hypothetical protein